MNTHVPATWLLANLLHPFLMAIQIHEGLFYFSSGDVPLLLPIFLYSLVFSLPSLILAFFAEYLLSRLQVKVSARFLLWLLTAPLIVVLNFGLLFLLFDTSFSLSDFGIALPAMAAVFITVLIRHKAFFKTYNKLRVPADEPSAVI